MIITAIFYLIILALSFVFVLSFAYAVHGTLSLIRGYTSDRCIDQLTRLTIGTLITGLHDTEQLDPCTLSNAIETISCRLTDMLLLNGYEIRKWNPRALTLAYLGAHGQLDSLLNAIEHSRTKQCQPDSTFSPPNTTP